MADNSSALFARLNSADVKANFIRRFAAKLGPGGVDHAIFKVLVTDAKDPGVAMGPDTNYVTVALMYNTRIMFKGEDITDLVEQKQIFKIGQSDKFSAADNERYTQWKTFTVNAQQKKAKADAGKQMDADFKKRGVNLELPESKKEKEAFVGAAGDREADIGPKYHNIVKLRFVNRGSDDEGTDTWLGAVLDAWFYYTSKSVVDTLKSIGYPDRSTKNNFDNLVGAIKDFIFMDLNARFIVLLDAWTGYNPKTHQNVGSEQLQALAKKLKKPAAAKSPVELTEGEQYLLGKHRMELSPPERHQKQTQLAFAKHGYYGKFGFITLNALKTYDKKKLVRHHPAVHEALAISAAGNPAAYPDFQFLITFKPVTINVNENTLNLENISLDSNPEKIIRVAYEKTTGNSLPQTLKFARINDGIVKYVTMNSFYDVCTGTVSESKLYDCINSGSLAVTCQQLISSEVPSFELPETRLTRQSTRKAPAAKRRRKAAFVDLGL